MLTRSSFLYRQEKNVSQDAVQGKIGKIYIPDQKVTCNSFICETVTLFHVSCFALFVGRRYEIT